MIVDESMQPWVGPQWRADSLIHQRAWCAALSAEKDVHVWIMTSWTKIWSCTGTAWRPSYHDICSVASPRQRQHCC